MIHNVAGPGMLVPLLELTSTQQVLLSATLGDTTSFEKDLVRRTGRAVSVVADAPRPVPLHFSYSLEPLTEVVKELTSTHRSPVYIVHFSQREAVAQAQALQPIALVNKEQRQKSLRRSARSPSGPASARFYRSCYARYWRASRGSPRYRRLVERLTQAGLQVICGTDTLGVGINVPIRTVLFTSLSKFDGSRSRHLSAREFHQIAGRAGRAGFDTVGDVVVQAPEYEIENARLVAKAGDDRRNSSECRKKKPPEGVVLWSEKTFNYLQNAGPETLTSQMRVNHTMILNVLQRPGNGVAAAIVITDRQSRAKDGFESATAARGGDLPSLHRAGVLIHHSAGLAARAS